MDACLNCGGTEFHAEAGFYYCNECHMQNETKKEQDVEFTHDSKTRLTSTRIQQAKKALDEEDRRLTSWEKYNFILIGLTNELIQVGAKENLKVVVAQLWSAYLAKLEVAFVSTHREARPKLSKKFDKKDAEIIYQKVFEKKKKKKIKYAGSVTSGSSASTSTSVRQVAKRKRLLFDSDLKSQVSSTTEAESSVASQSSDGELSDGSNSSSKSGPKGRGRLQFNALAREEIKLVTEKAKKVRKKFRKKFIATSQSLTSRYGPDIITPIKLWALLYLALRINNEDIHVSDIMRFIRDGHLSYYKLDHFIPSDITFTKKEAVRMNTFRMLHHSSLLPPIERLKKSLRVWKFPEPNLLTLIKKYCTELQLPNGVVQYAERILAKWPPGHNFDNKKYHKFPNYEAKAMAIVIVVMKMLVAEERRILDARLFSFREWQRYIQCRRRTLINEHFPSKVQYEPFSLGNSHLCVNFHQSLDDKRDQPTIGDMKHNYTPRALLDSMVDSIHEMANNLQDPKPSKVFTPSLTPQHSYLQQLLEDTKDTERTLPSILLQDFPNTKIGYIKNPESLKELAAQCDIELNIVYNSASYVRKVMQVFEPLTPKITLMQGLKKIHNNLTRVEAPTNKTISQMSDDPSDYLYRKRSGKILLETKKQRLFNKMMKLYQEQRLILEKQFYEQNNQTIQKSPEESQIIQNEFCESNQNNQDNDYFGFGQLLPNGKLKIPEGDSDSDDPPEKEDKLGNILLSKFEKQSIVNPISNPWATKKRFRNPWYETVKHNRPRPHPLVPYSRWYKQKIEALNAAEEKTKNTESAVKIIEPESTMSDIVVIVDDNNKNKENGIVEEENEGRIIYLSEDKKNEASIENIDLNQVPILILDDIIEVETIENKNTEIEIIKNKNNGIEIIDNKNNKIENKNTNEVLVEILEENEENGVSENEMQIDFEAIEHKIEIDIKNVPIIEMNEPEAVELSDDFDDIIINDDDESAKETDDNPAPEKDKDKEVIINDDSSDDEVSILTERIDSRPDANQKDSLPEKELLTLFIPYKQYWLLRISGFHETMLKHFRLLEREFPANFRWLFRECVNIIEVNPQVLYKEICLVESYYTDVLAPDEHMEKCEEYNTKWFRSKCNRTHITRRWTTGTDK
ncbi:Similar to TAF1B: TATA box-binding protein-associated factor RNA polymerase I subunit B (Drosophila melanogaster) [Cotesia congregata]|uniref:Similar to TAF1B: TATA box-binding protein-associated factor RNA polymerase I subunit B (Drosophila melanogaster) n=1 Tax=Cotesia congregata TaxID=51543 RepID=A0A8J2H0M5_COTCN|nr:Similar to TAF1B: TATA box-binding protein-associated factor RNA polymerase I subunit B (Drosophila melanogaster) [Cotesia congregata]